MKVEQSEIKSKGKIASRGRFVVFLLVFALLIIAAFVFILKTQDTKLDPASEMLAIKRAAKILKMEPNDITEEDFGKITELSLGGELKDIKFVEKFRNLEILNIQNVKYPKSKVPKWVNILSKIGIIDIKKRYSIDFSPLEKLPNLKTLIIFNVPVKNIRPFKKLTSLEKLLLHYDGADIKQIQYLTNLKWFELLYNKPVNLDLIKDFKNLESLDLQNTPVSNFEPLRELISLRDLSISNTKVTDIGPIAGLVNLEILDVPKQVSDIKPVRNLINLKELNLTETKVVNLEPISGLVNLEVLTIWKTSVSDITPIKNLKKLNRLDLHETQVTDLGPLSELTNLTRLNFLDVPVKSLEPLRGLKKMKTMEIDLTYITDLTPLKDIENHKFLIFKNYDNISDAQIADLQQAKHGLRVLYDKGTGGLSSSRYKSRL